MGTNFLQNLFGELEALVSPIIVGLRSEQDLQALLRRIGWHPENIAEVPIAAFAQALQSLNDAYNNDLLPLIDDPPTALSDIPSALQKAAAIVNALSSASTLLSGLQGAPPALASLGEDLLGVVTVQYLNRRSPVLTPILRLLNLIEEKQFEAVFSADGITVQRDPMVVDHFNIGGITDLLRDPLGTLKAAYGLENGLTQPDQTADTLFPRIADLARALGWPAFFGFDPADGIDLGIFGNDRAKHMLLLFVSVAGDQAGDSSGFGAGLLLDAASGLFVFPFGVLNLTETVGRWSVSLSSGASLPPFAVAKGGVTFDDNGPARVGVDLSATLLPAPQAPSDPTTGQQTIPTFLIGSTDGTHLEISQFKLDFNGTFATTGRDFGVLADIGEGALVISGGDGDGFLSSVLPSPSRIEFGLGVGWSTQRGLYFVGGASLDVTLPVAVSIAGVLKVQAIHLTIAVNGAEIDLTLSTTAAIAIGPVTATVDRVGLTSALTFPDAGGNLGPLDGTLKFSPPTGLGIAVDAGSVHGGGFISFDAAAGRYFGGLQLSIYDISVSAFGLIETKVPNVDFSFVILISAQFTPIQLGFGFTLNGVGGMVGINRSIDTAALGNLVRAGQSEELLFPKNVVADAPAILRDLTTVFPATQGRYVFGPLGKLGWGTPTLITGEIGIILEVPGLVVVLLGEVKCLLPKPDQALVKLNLSIDGELDFPNKTFSMDAALHDSVINGFPVSGQMAMRVSWGNQPNFVFSIGGFHPAYTPPPDFPKLQPMTLDLGSHGAAKISVSGFFAVTSNTVQVGGSATLHAGGSGISLDASVSVKALFVFSPFSFEADIDASVKISFHGYGPSVHLSGKLDGPSPWHIKGEVCVSIIWWDACLRFDVTFGGNQQVTQPALDPWVGAPAAAATPAVPAILGLHDALSDAGNWSGALVPGTVSSVTRAQGTDTLVDPVGGLTVRQKTVPVETPNPLTKFGVAKTTKPISFSKVQATLGTGPNTVSLKAVQAVNEFFAPAQFFEMDDGKKLSSAAFEPYQAGYLFATADGKNARGGSSVTFTPAMQTFIINSDGSDTLLTNVNYTPSDAKVTAANRRSAVAKSGLTLAGTRRFVNRAFTQSFSEKLPTFVIGSRATLALPAVPPPPPAVRSATLIALDTFRAQNVELASGVQVTALHDMPNPPTG